MLQPSYPVRDPLSGKGVQLALRLASYAGIAGAVWALFFSSAFGEALTRVSERSEDAYAASVTVQLSLMLVLWVVGMAIGNFGIVDFGWASGLVAITVTHFARGPVTSHNHTLTSLLASPQFLHMLAVAVWGGRVALYLLFRSVIIVRNGRVSLAPEEVRYAYLRIKWTSDRAAAANQQALLDAARDPKQRRPTTVRIAALMLVFFAIQGVLNVLLLAVPSVMVQFSSLTSLASLGHFQTPFVCGLLVSAIGILGEAAADATLAAHVRDPRNKGRTCRTGLWAYTRHPNYFFEWVTWLGFACMAMAVHAAGTGATGLWQAVLTDPRTLLPWACPLAMMYLLWFVTGIPLTERLSLSSRGDDFRQYQRTVNAFFPGPRRAVPAAAGQ